MWKRQRHFSRGFQRRDSGLCRHRRAEGQGGAYAVQGRARALFIENVEGDEEAVIGLPVASLRIGCAKSVLFPSLDRRRQELLITFHFPEDFSTEPRRT
jgi:hypothetical protein